MLSFLNVQPLPSLLVLATLLLLCLLALFARQPLFVHALLILTFPLQLEALFQPWELS